MKTATRTRSTRSNGAGPKKAEAAQHKKGKGPVPEQLAFDDPEFKAMMRTPLGESLTEYHGQALQIEKAEKKLALLDEKVKTEMRKVGKMYLRVQLEGVFYDFQIKIREMKETLVFKRANG